MKTNREILETLNKTVYGHEQAKKTLITLVKRSKTRYHQKWIQMIKNPVDTLNCLLVGDSGTGKTYLIEELAKEMNFPFLKVDATSLTPTGNNDGINQAKLKKMIVDKAEEYIKKDYGYYSVEGTIDQMVVFIDEMDKLAHSFDASGNWNKHVQSNFLTLIDNKEEFSGVSWVFAGAFAGVERKVVTKGMGFSGTDEETVVELDDDAVIKAGLIPELVGRLGAIVALDEFAEEDYKVILDTLVLPKKYKQLKMMGLEHVQMSAEKREELCKATPNKKQGVRALQREVEKYYLDTEFDAEPINHQPTV